LTSQPFMIGPLSVQSRRRPSDVAMNPPLRVPMSRRICMTRDHIAGLSCYTKFTRAKPCGNRRQLGLSMPQYVTAPAARPQSEARSAAADARTPAVPRAPKIAVSGMNFYYGLHRVLHNITLDIHPNEVTELIGPSGCGKSTFLRSLNRMNDIIPTAR